MTVMTRDDRQAAESQLSDDIPEVMPGQIVHVVTTDGLTLNNHPKPCRLAHAWSYPTAKGGLSIVEPGDSQPRTVPFSPTIYRAHPTGIKGGVPGGQREPGQTWHLRCPVGGAS